MNYQQILIAQYKTEFLGSFSNRNFEALLNLFESVLAFETPQQTGIEQTVRENIEKAFDPAQIGSVEAIKVLALELEPFLKKIILILEGSLDNVKKNKTNDVGFPECLEHLRINESFSKNSHIDSRNPQAHNSEILPFKKYYADLQDILFAYIYAVYLKYDSLYRKVHPSFTNYFANLKKELEKDADLQNHIELFARLDQKEKEITTLRKENNYLALTGEAGTGKTTTLKYLALQEAKKDNFSKIPIFLELGKIANFASESPIYNELEKKLKESFNLNLKDLFKHKQLVLFLDALDEFPEAHWEILKAEIENLIRKQNCDLIISTRPREYQFNVLKYAVLLPLSKKQEEMYINNRITDSSKQKELLDALQRYKLPEQNIHWFVNIVEMAMQNKPLPQNTIEIVDQYLEMLFEREKQKPNKNFDVYRLFLVDSVEKMADFEALKEIEKPPIDYGIDHFLDWAKGLGILDKNSTGFKFRSQKFKEHFTK